MEAIPLGLLDGGTVTAGAVLLYLIVGYSRGWIVTRRELLGRLADKDTALADKDRQIEVLRTAAAVSAAQVEKLANSAEMQVRIMDSIHALAAARQAGPTPMAEQ